VALLAMLGFKDGGVGGDAAIETNHHQALLAIVFFASQTVIATSCALAPAI